MKVRGFDPGDSSMPNTYDNKLILKFGISNRIEQYKGSNVAIAHRCVLCSFLYNTTPSYALTSNLTCKKCSREKIANTQKTTKESFLLKLENKFIYIKCLSFESNHSYGKFSCDECNNSWSQKPYEILKLTHGCPCCAKYKKGETKAKSSILFLKQLKNINKNIIPIDTYQRSNKRIKCLCKICDYKWMVTPNNLLNGSKCPYCSFANKNTFKFKYVKIGKRILKVQGYEPQAIEFLAKKFDIRKIKTFSEGKIPIIPYHFDGLIRKFYPDLMINDTIYEVKSTWTLFNNWEKNIAKFKACQSFQIPIKFILVSEKGKVFILKNNWIKWNTEQIGKVKKLC